MSAHRYLGKCLKKYGGCETGLAQMKDSHESHIWVTCPHCAKRALLKRVEGEFNPDHKCDPRCTGAVGNTCTCACGGANHGADHDFQNIVAVRAPVTASDFAIRPEPVEVPVSGHVGTVGENLCVNVTVQSVRSNVGSNNSTLYTFITDDGHTVKWFAPDYVDPEWEQGDKLKLSAKVRSHDTHERFGKSTNVIYGEKVSSE